MSAHGYLDKFTLLGQCVILEGWASDFELELRYDEQTVPLSVQRVLRPDLIAVFGPEAERWGFAACAALPSGNLDRKKFRLKFNAEIEWDAPQDRFSAPGDVAFRNMTAAFREKVASTAGATLLEVGARARSGNSYRSWFPSVSRYIGVDVAAGTGVDIVGDAHHLSRVVRDSVDFVFSMAVFEHILMPWKVALEMNYVMKQGAAALIISHNAWPLHEEPWDFWRYSKEAWSAIFNRHTGFRVVASEYEYPASIVPDYIHTENLQVMSMGPAYLLSGCHVEKVADPAVSWDAEAADVFDLRYSHA